MVLFNSGHLAIGGVVTLKYDAKCCHIEGECEWVACNDTIVSSLAGGTHGGPVTGVYVGGGTELQTITVPTANTPSRTNSTVLVFAAWGVRAARLTLGNQSFARLQIIATSPTHGVSLELSGGILGARSGSGPRAGGGDIGTGLGLGARSAFEPSQLLRVSTFNGSGQLVNQQLLNHTTTQHPLSIDSRLWFRTVLEWLPNKERGVAGTGGW